MRLTFEDELRSGSLLCGGTGLADSMVTLGEPGDGYALKDVNRRLDVTTFWAGTFSWQDPVHSWKAGPGEIMTVENKQTNLEYVWAF